MSSILSFTEIDENYKLGSRVGYRTITYSLLKVKDNKYFHSGKITEEKIQMFRIENLEECYCESCNAYRELFLINMQ